MYVKAQKFFPKGNRAPLWKQGKAQRALFSFLWPLYSQSIIIDWFPNCKQNESTILETHDFKSWLEIIVPFPFVFLCSALFNAALSSRSFAKTQRDLSAGMSGEGFVKGTFKACWGERKITFQSSKHSLAGASELLSWDLMKLFSCFLKKKTITELGHAVMWTRVEYLFPLAFEKKTPTKCFLWLNRPAALALFH